MLASHIAMMLALHIAQWRNYAPITTSSVYTLNLSMISPGTQPWAHYAQLPLNGKGDPEGKAEWPGPHKAAP